MGTNLNSNLEVLFSKMENFVASKTVVGDPIHIDNIIIIPLIDISLGVGASASDNNSTKENENIINLEENDANQNSFEKEENATVQRKENYVENINNDDDDEN